MPQLDGEGGSIHRDFIRGRVDAEHHVEGLADGDGLRDTGILVADFQNGLATLIGRVLCHLQQDRGGFHAPGIAAGSALNPIAVVGNRHFVADIRLEIHSDSAALHRHVESCLIDTEHSVERLADGDGFRDTRLLITNDDNGLTVFITGILSHLQFDGRRLHASCP